MSESPTSRSPTWWDFLRCEFLSQSVIRKSHLNYYVSYVLFSLSWIVLWSQVGFAWFCMVLHGIASSCTILHYIALFCTILHYLALSCTILHYLALSCTCVAGNVVTPKRASLNPDQLADLSSPVWSCC